MPPLITCVMPTANRRAFVPLAVACFLRQGYAPLELLVVDDGADPVGDLLPPDPRVRYVRVPPGRTLGAKRNLCVELARGELIMHWDDDDWHAPGRIAAQAAALRAAGAEVCGMRRLLFHDPAAGRTWLYQYPPEARPWLAGGTLLYTRGFWRRRPFPDLQVGSDTRFVWERDLGGAAVVDDLSLYVARIHPGNTSPKQREGGCWRPWPGDVAAILGPDYPAFAGAARPAPTPTSPAERRSPMRIGYVVLSFPMLSETFIRREILALCDLGQRVFVYADQLASDPLVPPPSHPNLTVRAVPFLRRPDALALAAAEDGVEHLHSTLLTPAHRAALRAARAAQIPFSIRAYSGYATFAHARDNALYAEVAAEPLCDAVVVEDPFMLGYAAAELGVPAERCAAVANSIDLELYHPPERRPAGPPLPVLSIARFVPKKGLTHLVRAFLRVAAVQPDAELWLVGAGPEEPALRAAAAGHPAVRFLGLLPETETRRRYAEAAVFALPCVRPPDGDADGVPTTVLEAMACGLPVVASDLLSLPHYVRHGQEGLLAPPGDEVALAEHLGRLLADPALRAALGAAGRGRVAELCDIRRNGPALLDVFVAGRQRRWRQSLDALQGRRAGYTPERLRYYERLRGEAMAHLRPAGRVLDIGCGGGELRRQMPPGVVYVGCDPLPLADPPFEFHQAGGEALPFPDASFDSVILYSVLHHVLSVEAVLAEAARVLRPGGRLLIHEPVDDPNPIHLNHLSARGLEWRLPAGLDLLDSRPAGAQRHYLVARKPGGAAVAPAARPLASIAVTAYNRAPFIRQCLDSALAQTYSPLEVVVYDDGSTDGTRAILAEYAGRVRVELGERNRGTAYAKNRALRLTADHAAYVAILDSDDYYHPRFVERCVAALEQHPAAGLAYVDDVLVDAAGRTIRHQPAVQPWDREAWLRSCNLRGDTWLARRDLVMRTALHDERLAFDVDYDLFYQLLELAEFVHVGEYLACVREHAGRGTRNALELAKCHAANLVRYGYSPDYAYLRARGRPEWLPAIAEGIALGERLRAEGRPARGKL